MSLKIDNKITIGFVLALFLQAGATFWWASQLTTTVDTNTSSIAKNASKLKEMEDDSKNFGEILARLDERSAGTTRDLNRIEGKLDKLEAQ